WMQSSSSQTRIEQASRAGSPSAEIASAAETSLETIAWRASASGRYCSTAKALIDVPDSAVRIEIAAGDSRTGNTSLDIGIRVLMHDQRERLVEVDRRYAHLIVRAARCVCGEVEPDLVRPRARPGMLVLVVAEVVETVPVMDVHGIGAARGEPF